MDNKVQSIKQQALQALKLFETNYEQYVRQFGQRIPVKIQIGSDQFYLIPQYPDTEIHLIQILIRSIYEQIPQNQKLYLNNWTKGRQIGQSLQAHQTISQLLDESNQKIPTIRVCWENCKKLRVRVDVHDIIIMDYNEIGMFNSLIDILDSITNDIKKQFKLDPQTSFGLKVQNQSKIYSKLCFVGRHFDFNKQNYMKVMINFKEKISREFVKEHNNGKYQHLVCPISQLVMQEPVQTSCRHIFDKLCLSLCVMKDGRCPVCRKPLQMRDIKPCRKLKNEIKRLRSIDIEKKRQEWQNAKKQQQIDM